MGSTLDSWLNQRRIPSWYASPWRGRSPAT